MAIEGMTIGQFLAWSALDRDAAWAALYGMMHAAAQRGARRRRRQTADAEDAGDLIFLRAVASDLARLRRKPAGVSLAAWTAVAVTNVFHELARNRGVRPPNAGLGEARTAEEAAAPETRSIDRSFWTNLPPAQRAVALGMQRNLSDREIALELGWTLARVRGAKRRALRRIRAGCVGPPLSEVDRSWAALAARRASTKGDETTTLVLDMYVAGRSRAEIAAATGLSKVAVKERIHRRRGRIEAPLPIPPPPTFIDSCR